MTKKNYVSYTLFLNSHVTNFTRGVIRNVKWGPPLQIIIYSCILKYVRWHFHTNNYQKFIQNHQQIINI